MKMAMEKKRVGWVFIRCLFGVISFSTMNYSVTLLPVSIAMVLKNLGSFWTALMAFLILGDRMSCMNIICMVGSFSGVVVLTYSEKPDDQDHCGESELDKFGVAVAIISSFAVSLVYISTKKLKGVSAPLISLLYGILISVVMVATNITKHLIFPETYGPSHIA
jgi:drug/metabolite transporter (DMT)-like permease